MPSPRSGLLAAAIAAWAVSFPAVASAQRFEVSPFFGVRFGGDFFELVTNQPVDLDAASAAGVVVNVPLADGLQIEAFASHQEARVDVPATAFVPASRWRVTVDHWLAGGLQEFGERYRVRPFLTGLLGLTRYAAEGDNEIRFTVGAGGGVKLFPLRRLGVRLDGRVLTTFVDAEGRAVACSPGFCLVGFDADVVWQAELTAAVVVVF